MLCLCRSAQGRCDSQLCHNHSMLCFRRSTQRRAFAKAVSLHRYADASLRYAIASLRQSKALSWLCHYLSLPSQCGALPMPCPAPLRPAITSHRKSMLCQRPSLPGLSRSVLHTALHCFAPAWQRIAQPRRFCSKLSQSPANLRLAIAVPCLAPAHHRVASPCPCHT